MPPTEASGCCSRSEGSEGVEVQHSSTTFEGDDENNLEMVPPPPRCPVTLEFHNITYSATRFNMSSMKFERKQLLHGISGTLKPGELTAIIGPSGAGKTTLLNILAGFTVRGVGGTVLTNGRPHTLADGPLARYIRQQDQLRPHLTAVEAMNYAANLKMGYTISQHEKDKKVKFTLSLVGLWNTRNTLSGALSGGQRRRLAVALELLSDPPVLLLDEPTTGLDAVSARAVMGRLVALAHAGRTVAATLHGAGWPALASCGTILCTAEGRRLYRGPPGELPPRLAAAALPCPPYHNPADFLLEIASGQHDVDLIKLSEAISEPDPPCTKADKEPLTKATFGLEIIKLKRSKRAPLDLSLDDFGPVSATVLQQTWLLLKRNLLILSRSYSLYLWRVAAHIVIALLFGYLYAGVGEKAGKELANYVYLYGSMLLVVYTGKMSVTLSFPLEIECLEREHFNGWYKLGPYIISLLAIEIPFQAVCCVIYGATSYWLTGNPVVWWRIGLILIAMILTSLSAQGWGYFIGSTTPVKIAVFLGPVLAVLFSVFGFCISLADTPAVFRWLYHASYFRAGFHDVVYAVYGFDRPKLPCTKPEGGLEYCHFAIPSKFLKEMAILDISIVNNILLLCGTMVTMHILNCVALWVRLNKR